MMGLSVFHITISMDGDSLPTEPVSRDAGFCVVRKAGREIRTQRRREGKVEKQKRIELVEMRVGDLKSGFGNPRKIKKKKREELEQSLDTHGDFGIFVIDENDDIICGNQRAQVLKYKDPDTVVQCKRLIGYSYNEKKAINIKDNTHAGEWDLDLLADWTADLMVSDLGLDIHEKDPDERTIKDMELIRYEKYDYVMIVCRNEPDYLNLCRALGIDGAKVAIHQKRKIKARAIWFDDMKAQIVPKDEANTEESEAETS